MMPPVPSIDIQDIEAEITGAARDASRAADANILVLTARVTSDLLKHHCLLKQQGHVDQTYRHSDEHGAHRGYVAQKRSAKKFRVHVNLRYEN